MKCSSSQLLWWSIGTICCVLLISQTTHFLKSVMNSVPTKESLDQDNVPTTTNAKNVLVNFQESSSKKPTYTNPSPDATLNDSSNCKKWAATSTKIGDRGQVTNDILNKNSKNDSDQPAYILSAEEKPDDSRSIVSQTEVTENHQV
eukprot:954329_1